MDRSLYPKNWNDIALAIKVEAGWTCKGCGRPCREPGECDVDLIDRIKGTVYESDLWETVEDPEYGAIEIPKLGRFVLTVAHLNHIPPDVRRENLKALCSVCHCRYDLAAMKTKKRLKLERLGQLTLPLDSVVNDDDVVFAN